MINTFHVQLSGQGHPCPNPRERVSRCFHGAIVRQTCQPRSLCTFEAIRHPWQPASPITSAVSVQTSPPSHLVAAAHGHPSCLSNVGTRFRVIANDRLRERGEEESPVYSTCNTSLNYYSKKLTLLSKDGTRFRKGLMGCRIWIENIISNIEVFVKMISFSLY